MRLPLPVNRKRLERQGAATTHGITRARCVTDTRPMPAESGGLHARLATSEGDLATVTQTISRAFHEDPTWSWAFPDLAEIRTRL